MLLFISTLDISDDDISVIKPVYEGTKKDDKYKIVWIPIVEQWTDDLRKKFEVLWVKMPWYTVQYFAPVAGIRFIKEEWHFKGKPAVVVMNPQGKVENTNALHLIRIHGMKAFPFHKGIEDTLTNDKEWITPIVNDIHPTIQTWVINPIHFSQFHSITAPILIQICGYNFYFFVRTDQRGEVHLLLWRQRQ